MNPFDKQRRPKEINERLNQKSREANELIENARMCLEDPKFQQFKERYAQVFAGLVQCLLEMPRNNDTEFASQVDSIRCKIQVLQGFGFLIEDVANTQKRPILPTTTEGITVDAKTS